MRTRGSVHHPLGALRVKQSTYTALLVVSGLLMGLLHWLVSVGYFIVEGELNYGFPGGNIFKGNTALAVSELLPLSLPAFLVLAVLAATVSYRWYIHQELGSVKAAGLLVIAFCVVVGSLALTLLILWAV